MSGKRFACTFGLALSLLVLIPAASWAQSGIAGVVKDTTGAVLPGVTVEASSPALIEQVRSVVTNERGEYRITDLRPGTYSITFTLPGFSVFKRDDLVLPTDFTATINTELRVGELAETVNVSGQSPLVDVQNTQQRQVLASAVIDAIPSIRFVHNYATYMPASSGTTFTSNGTDQRKYFVHNGRPVDSVVAIDGFSTNFTPGFTGNSSFFMNSAIAQEVSIQSSGGSAEQVYGGVLTNVIPKEGGNKYTGYFYGNYSGGSMQSDNLDDNLRSRGLTIGTKNIRLFDIDPAFGGPIVKDKVWIFLAGESSAVDRYRAGVYYNSTPLGWKYTPDMSRPAHNKNSDTDWSMRLTMQPTPRNKVQLFVDQQIHYYHQRNSDETTTAVPSPETTNYTPEWPNIVYNAVWKSTVTNKLLLDIGAGAYITAIPTRPSRDPGYTVDPLSIVPALDQASNTCIRAPGPLACSGWNSPWNRSVNSRAAMAYVTGAHAVKMGFQFRYGDVGSNGGDSKEYGFRIGADGKPNQVTLTAKPNYNDHRGVEYGWYSQDQWTIDRLTLNYGARLEHQHEWVPAGSNPAGLFVPARSWAAVENVPNYWDFSPRLSLAYDVFGTHKTAVKTSINRYVINSLGGISAASDPATSLLVAQVTRTILGATTSLDASGNWILPGCDLANPRANGVCLQDSDLNFGNPNPTNLGYNPDILTGWGVRAHQWEFSTQVDQQITSGLSMNAGYFRRWYRGFTGTVNTALAPADFTPFCVTAPVSSALPSNVSGSSICGLYDALAAKASNVANQVDGVGTSSLPGKQTENWNGVDLQMNWRGPRGAMLSGGMSTGRTHLNTCFQLGQPQVSATSYGSTFKSSTGGTSTPDVFCDVLQPWQTSVRFLGNYYGLPGGFEVSGTVQNVPGQALKATANYTAAQTTLGRNFATASNITVNLLPQNQYYLPRETQVDMRFARRIRRGRLSLTPSVDIINLLNNNGIEAYNTQVANLGVLNTSYPVPTRIQFARYLKLNILMEF